MVENTAIDVGAGKFPVSRFVTSAEFQLKTVG